MLRAVVTSPIPPMCPSATSGSATRPTTIKLPWKTSDHTTAVKPPWVM